jgi:hypothetical protein
MKCTDDNNLIPKEQYSSRKALKAIDQVANKCLIYDLAQLQRRPMALCSNDAKSCYDRMVYLIASIALQ